MIDINVVTDFYMWLLILNISFILIRDIFISFGFNFIYMVIKKSNYIGSKEEINKLMWKIDLQYGALFVLFVIVPFIALLLINP